MSTQPKPQIDPYGTHLPLLIKVVGASTGPVLELGIGTNSTPVLHRLCAEQGRLVVSCDTDVNYIERLGPEYSDKFHEFYWIEDWDKADIEKPWGVVLVDHRPARRRYRDAARVAPFSEFTVCHDTELHRDRFYRWQRAFRHYKFRFDDDGDPRTTVLSNFHDLEFLKGTT